MARSFHIPRYVLWPLRLLLAGIVVTVLFLGALVWWLSTDHGKTYVEHVVQKELSEAIDYQIHAGDIRFQFPLSASISELSLADAKGIWMEASAVTLHILPTPTIQHHLVIRKVAADTVTLLRAPETNTSSDSSGGMDISVLGMDIRKATISPDITGLEENIITSLTGSLNWRASSNALSFELESDTAQGMPQIGAATLSATGQYRLDKDVLEFSELTLASPKMVATGKGSINLSLQTLEISGESEEIHLGDWVQDLTGTASAAAMLTGTFSQPAVEATIHTSAVAYDGRTIPDATHHLTAKQEGDSWNGAVEIRTATDQHASADYRWQESLLELENITARYGQNQASGALAVHLDSFLADGTIKASLPDLADLPDILPEKMTGSAHVTALLSGNKATQGVQVKADLRNFTVKGLAAASGHVDAHIPDISNPMPESIKLQVADALYEDMVVEKASLDVTPKGDRWDVRLEAEGKDALPFGISASGRVASTSPDAWNVNFPSFAGNYGYHTLKSAVEGTFTVAENTSGSSIHGQMQLADGSYQFLPVGASLQHIRATLIADGNRFTLKDFQAEDANGHLLSGSGSAETTGNMTYQAEFHTNNLALINHPNAKGTLSGNLTLSGNQTQGNLGGSLSSESLNIYLPDRFAGSVPVLNVVEIIPAPKGRKPRFVAQASYPIFLDVSWEADNKVFVRGWGLDAELKGKLKMKGQVSATEIEGKLTTIRGRYNEFGKYFTVKKGELVFEGDMPPSPYMNVTASTTESGVEIRPVLSGPLLKPALKVESSPAMPQEEALSVLLFGTDSSKISAIQAAQLANSLVKLSGKGGVGFDPLGKARDVLGVDDINVSGTGENATDTTVGVGKYIGDNVYLEVERGAQTGSGKARVEVELTPSISVESATGATGDNSVGVNWKYDY